MGGGGSREKMTKCDMGGGGLKNGPFWSDILLAWPLSEYLNETKKYPIDKLKQNG